MTTTIHRPNHISLITYNRPSDPQNRPNLNFSPLSDILHKTDHKFSVIIWHPQSTDPSSTIHVATHSPPTVALVALMTREALVALVALLALVALMALLALIHQIHYSIALLN